MKGIRSHDRYIFSGSDVPRILYTHADIDVQPLVGTNTNVCIVTNNNTDVDACVAVDAWYLFDVPKIIATIGRRSGGYMITN
ncbi:hypothetical protein J1N35_034506 [Gossypium stocksii]|uniref:Uncharacterized protein n=1 Tax=Gossypium stocksii TaxID=47602 RepID=A0A9D3USG5_9ROSI|nr:hypothetical protein J1N35_034506 [Gossypium stocksii]